MDTICIEYFRLRYAGYHMGVRHNFITPYYEAAAFYDSTTACAFHFYD